MEPQGGTATLCSTYASGAILFRSPPPLPKRVLLGFWHGVKRLALWEIGLSRCRGVAWGGAGANPGLLVGGVWDGQPYTPGKVGAIATSTSPGFPPPTAERPGDNA